MWYAHGTAGIAAGEDWEGRLRREIERCDVMVILASHHLHGSPWCKKEAQYALNLRKHVLVIRVDDRPLPGWVDFLGGDRQHLALYRTSLHAVAEQLAELCHDAMDGHLNPGEDVAETLDLPFEVAARGHVHPVVVRRGASTAVHEVVIPPCGRNQTVRKDLGGASTLTVYVRVLPSQRFELQADGVSVVVSVQVSAEVLEHCERIDVPTLDGTRQVPVPQQARHPGGRIHLKGQGVGPRGQSTGDLVVQLVVFGQQAPLDLAAECRAAYLRLGPVVPHVIAASTILAALAALAPLAFPSSEVGVSVLLYMASMLGYGLIGVLFGALAYSQRHDSVVDGFLAWRPVLCVVPVVGPWALRWCLGELDVGGCRANVLRWLMLHVAFASAAGVAMFLHRQESPSEIWGPIVVLFVVPAGICLWRTWKAMPDPPPAR